MVNGMTRPFKWIWNSLLALNLYASFTDSSTFRRLVFSVLGKIRLIILYLSEKFK